MPTLQEPEFPGWPAFQNWSLTSQMIVQRVCQFGSIAAHCLCAAVQLMSGQWLFKTGSVMKGCQAFPPTSVAIRRHIFVAGQTTQHRLCMCWVAICEHELQGSGCKHSNDGIMMNLHTPPLHVLHTPYLWHVCLATCQTLHSSSASPSIFNVLTCW